MINNALLYVYIIDFDVSVKFFSWKKDPFSPAVVFCASFVFCCSWAVVFANQWRLELHINTFNVIIFGVFTYMASTLCARVFMEKIKGRKVYLQEISSIEVQNWIILLCILIEIFVIVLSIFTLKKSLGLIIFLVLLMHMISQ